MGSKLNNGYVGSNEIFERNFEDGHYETEGRGIISGRKNYLASENREYKQESNWDRNPQWIEMPEIPEGEEKVQILYAVYDTPDDESRTLVLYAAGSYEVDWGDGNTSTGGAYSNQYNIYNFSSLDSSTETDEGYRQVIITLTPQAGQTIFRVYMNQSYDALGFRGSNYTQNYLDVLARLPNCSPDQFRLPYSHSLERVVIKEFDTSSTSWSGFLANKRGLRHVELPTNLSNVTNFQNMFAYCHQLEAVPQVDMSSATDLYRMYFDCPRLKKAPNLGNLPNVTTIQQMYYDCRDLEYAGDMNLSSTCTNALSAFSSNYRLKSVPELGDTSGLQTTSSMFTSCLSLLEIPSMNLSSCTNANNMFSGCWRLEKINTIDFNGSAANMQAFCYNSPKLKTVDIQGSHNVTNMYQAFRRCERLEGLTLDTSSVTNGYQIFLYCYQLEQLPSGLNTSNMTSTNNLFDGCQSLKEMNNVDFSSTTNTSSMFNNTGSLKNVSGFTGPSLTHDWSYTPLNADSVRNIFNGLPTVSGQTINMTRVASVMSGSVTAGDIAVATAKGWSVTT